MSQNAFPKMICSSLIIVLIASFCLNSVDAIRCHQCNSHLEEDCNVLRLNTPRAPRDDQYLRECEGNAENNGVAFCRKTVTKIEHSGEQRVVRGCGWITAGGFESNNSCLNADDEGYLQTICTCFQDGCNAAPSLIGQSTSTMYLLLTGCSLMFVSLLWSIRQSD